jgi:hypothetical protein
MAAYTKKYKATLLESQCRPFQLCLPDLCDRVTLTQNVGVIAINPQRNAFFRFAGKRSVYRISEQSQWNIITKPGTPFQARITVERSSGRDSAAIHW